jgi:hypothetical protein
VIAKRNKLSFFFTSDFFEILIKKAKGIANNILAIFEPAILPNVIPCKPFNAEFTEIASSGADVPKATKVKAIINGCTLRCLANATDPVTRYSPLKYSINIPIKR